MYLTEKEGEARKYTTVSIPTTLANRIDQLVENGRGGYASRPDFVLDAIRRRLRDFDMLE